MALGYASAELRGDIEVALIAVNQDTHDFSSASEELRTEKEIVGAVVTQNIDRSL